MTGWASERLAALAGIVGVACWVVGILVLESSNPGGEQPAELLAWFRDDTSSILASGFIFMLGSLFFIVFVGALRARLVAAEGANALWTAIAFGSGLATAVLTMLIPAANLSAAINESDLTEESALAISLIDDAFFVGAELTAALMVVATGLVILRYGALPRWLAWAGFVLALWLLIPPIGWAGLIFGVPLWTIAAALFLWMRPVGEPSAAPPPSQM
jgi:hypothetical protein